EPGHGAVARAAVRLHDAHVGERYGILQAANQPRRRTRKPAAHMKYFALALLASPVAAAGDPAPICTDRPTKANALCTVPAGRLQFETSAVGWSLTKLYGSRS